MGAWNNSSRKGAKDAEARKGKTLFESPVGAAQAAKGLVVRCDDVMKGISRKGAKDAKVRKGKTLFVLPSVFVARFERSENRGMSLDTNHRHPRLSLRSNRATKAGSLAHGRFAARAAPTVERTNAPHLFTPLRTFAFLAPLREAAFPAFRGFPHGR